MTWVTAILALLLFLVTCVAMFLLVLLGGMFKR
jgi:hypothetical protein